MNKQNRSQFWSSIGATYEKEWADADRSFLYLIERNFLTQALKTHIQNKKNLRALDLGSGTGRILSILEKESGIRSVTSVDFSPEMLGFCKNRFKRSKKIRKFLLFDISKHLPFPDSSFDCITTVRVIKYSKNWKEILKECYRVLAPNGLLIFDMPNTNSVNTLSPDPLVIYKTNKLELEKILDSLGFRIVTIGGSLVLPGFLSKLIPSKVWFTFLRNTEILIKKVFGEFFMTRFLYIACEKNSSYSK